MEKQPTYTEAYNELQSIVKKMENADISVDELTKNIERALQLIRICKEKLDRGGGEQDHELAHGAGSVGRVL